jgi:hypothetical protein
MNKVVPILLVGLGLFIVYKIYKKQQEQPIKIFTTGKPIVIENKPEFTGQQEMLLRKRINELEQLGGEQNLYIAKELRKQLN